MSPETQRIKIAEACGWKFIADYCHGEDQPPDYTTVTPDGRHLCGHYPDYFNDLNAMHEAESFIRNAQDQMRYASEVLIAMGFDDLMEASDLNVDYCWHAMGATAAQRCEAFLRTIGKWVTA